MDNPTKWNISNSAQNIVSALVDPSQQFDGVFRREWSTTFAGFSRLKLTSRSKTDSELRGKLINYMSKLETRRHNKAIEDRQTSRQDKGNVDDHPEKTFVPEIFSKENFDLSELDTFLKVVSVADKSDSRVDHRDTDLALHANHAYSGRSLTKNELRDLQQQLTDYLDIIEESLASQISNRSGDFFQVMSSVDCVMDELSLAIKSVTNLRKKCARLNASLIVPNMKCMQLNKKRDNAKSVLDKMNEVAYLCKVQSMIQVLLSASDFVGALDLIAKSRIMLHKDLTRVTSLRHLESQLNEIERMIGTMVQQEFLTLISSEWDGPVNQHTSAASRLSKLFDYFANGYVEIPERGGLTLLSLLQIQAEKFVNQFHEERKKRVESTLDIEQWKVIDVPYDFQRLITMVVDEKIAIHDIFSCENMQQLSSSRNTSEGSMPKFVQPKAGSRTSNDTDSILMRINSDKELTKLTEKGNLMASHVETSGSTYVIVESVINLIRTVMDYCKCAHVVRSLSTDLLERLFKILLLYNTKTYHLVFSAGAVQVAGLKTITTRSLLVSQRSLNLIILLIPAIRKHFARLLPENDNRLRRFDEIRMVYEEHATKIPERVKTVLKSVIDLELQGWEAKPPVPSQQFGSISQYLSRMHENILDVLPARELKWLFMEISETFKDVLVRHLRRLRIDADAGPQQWLVMQDLTFYRISLSKLSAFKSIELNFDDIWSRLAEGRESEEQNNPA